MIWYDMLTIIKRFKHQILSSAFGQCYAFYCYHPPIPPLFIYQKEIPIFIHNCQYYSVHCYGHHTIGKHVIYSSVLFYWSISVASHLSSSLTINGVLTRMNLNRLEFLFTNYEKWPSINIDVNMKAHLGGM